MERFVWAVRQLLIDNCLQGLWDINCCSLLNTSVQPVGQVEYQSEHCNRAQVKAWHCWQTCRTLVIPLQLQDMRVATKEQNGVDTRKQRNESVQNWEAWPKQHHHEPRELQQHIRTFQAHAFAKKARFCDSKGRYGESVVSKFGI
eukprot:5188621-Amphidinium_carterae.1